MDGSGGLIVDCDETALAEGMKKFLAGEITPTAFDPDVYNAEVIGEFEAAVFAMGPSEGEKGKESADSMAG
ncbi:hypothetical protein DN550_35180 [Burkholderia multivorans]|nr:hypothetical protein DN550_35180 [Burkholderia multivorans]